MRKHTGIVLFVVLFVIAARAPVRYTGGDPWGCLLVSRALVTHGSFALDPFPEYLAAKPSNVYRHDGHAYYYFPPGTSVLAAPAVYVALGLGVDPRDQSSDTTLQLFLAAAVFAGCGVLAYLLARRRLPAILALAMVAAFLLGTGAIANTATALRSHGPVMLLGFGAIVLLTRNGTPRRRDILLAGALLGYAVWCRPTAVAGMLCAPLVLLPHRRLLIRCWLAAGAMLIVMLFMFRLGYGVWLHPYYGPTRMDGDGNVLAGLLGNLFSLSRGQLTTAPFLLPLLGVLAFRPASGSAKMRVVAGLLWWALLLAIVSRFPNWVAGHSFGNRFLLDALPGLFLAGVESVVLLREEPRRLRRAGALTGLAALAVAGIWINTVKGAYDSRTALWSQLVDIGANQEMSWSWRDAQWRMDNAMLRRLSFRHDHPVLPAVALDETITADDDSAYFSGFNALETAADSLAWRWSSGAQASVIWLPAPAIRAREDLSLSLRIGAFASQDVAVLLNGRPIGHVTHEDFTPRTYVLPVTAADLSARLPGLPGDPCVLELRPSRPADVWRSSRRIGVAFFAASLGGPVAAAH